MTSQSDADHGLVELERSECLALLGSVPVGRLVSTHQALPTVRPANFRLLPDAVYVRTSGEGSAARAARAARAGAVVAFEADDYDVDARWGWSVVVVGRMDQVTDPGLLARLADLPLAPWASGSRDHVVRIPLELVTGRRAGGPLAYAPAPRAGA